MSINLTTRLTETHFNQVNQLIRDFNANLSNAQRQYPGTNFGVPSIAQMTAAVYYRPRNVNYWYLYQTYQAWGDAQNVARQLTAQYGRNYEFAVAAR